MATSDDTQGFDAFATADDFRASLNLIEEAESRISRAKAAGAFLLLSEALWNHPFIIHASIERSLATGDVECHLYGLDRNGSAVVMTAQAILYQFSDQGRGLHPVPADRIKSARNAFSEAIEMASENVPRGSWGQSLHRGAVRLRAADAGSLARALGLDKLAVDIERRALAKEAPANAPSAPTRSL